MKKTAALLALPLATLALIAGCGGDDSSSDSSGTNGSNEAAQPAQQSGGATADQAGSGGNVLELQADPSGALAYEETSLTAEKPGKVQIDFTNDSPIGHDVVIEKDGQEVARSSVITGSSEVVSFDAKAGDYTFYCSVPGHREAGMEGTLTVK
ncbi:MAG: hypothetical protein KDB62_02535 [Solirubrobacterales bacterium]|nr:hypothetical protein [Solirubrobacterales bacterium]